MKSSPLSLYSCLLMATMFLGGLQAQQKSCGTDEAHQHNMQDPIYQQNYQAYQEALQTYLANPIADKTDTLRIIPVVVHVIHDGAIGNVTDEKVQELITYINKDYRKLNPEVAPAHFDSLAADCWIQFRLAKLDPQGNCTNGITRTQSTQTYYAENNVKELIYWDTQHYLNIWVVQHIDKTIRGGLGVAGFATFPGTTVDSRQGIVLDQSQVGYDAFNRNRTVTHEAGHWLGLRHIWGDGATKCSGDDGVNDTPQHCGPNLVAAFNIYPKLVGTWWDNTSNPACVSTGPNGEMFMNYMDYSAGYEQNMFTKGQKQIMDFTLANYRRYLHSTENLRRTGVIDGPTTCKPVVSFYTNRKMICEGDNIDFTPVVSNGTVSTYNWTFEGGNPATSSNATPNGVQYPAQGLYSATLEASNAQGSGTATTPNVVIVSPTTAQYSGSDYFAEAFDGPADIADWYIFNDGNDAVSWKLSPSNTGAGTRPYSLMLENQNNEKGEIDELVSPSYNLTGVSSPTLRFTYTGATNQPTLVPNDDASALITNPNRSLLKVYISKNCGKNWVLLSGGTFPNATNATTLAATRLYTAGFQESPYYPMSSQDWKTQIVTIPANFADETNVRFKFEYTSAGKDNNFFLDDVNIGSNLLGIDEYTGISNLEVYPNPTNNSLQISFQSTENQTVSMQMYDLVGKKVQAGQKMQVGIGTHTLQADCSNLQQGTYLLNIQVGDKTVVKKINVLH